MEIRATHRVTLNAFPVRPPIREGLNSARPFERPSDDDAQTRKHVSRDSRTGLRPEAVHGRSSRDPDQSVRHRGSADEIPGPRPPDRRGAVSRSEEHTSELQSHSDLVCRLLLEKKK